MSFSTALIITAAVSGLSLLCWRFPAKRATTHGSARWLTIWEAFRKGLFRPRGLIIGTWTGRLPVYADTPHAITFGWVGSGKGTSAILPNLLTYRYLFVNDPGGENTAVAIGHWRKQGYETYVINPFGMHTDAPWSLPSHNFNPLSILDPASTTFAADAMLIAEMLVTRTGKESGSSLFFKDAAQSALRAMIMHIATNEPPANQHLGTLFAYVNADASGWGGLMKAMKANPVAEGIVSAEANVLERREEQAPEEFSAILSTAQQDLNWLADPLVRRNMRRSEVDLQTIKGLKPGQKGGVIAVVMPLEYSESYGAIARLAMGCAVWAMQRGELARAPALFAIDEAAALGKIPRFPSWLATLRKYRARLWPIFQNVGQVKALYGGEWQTFIANCGLKQFLGIGDIETAEYVEKLLGYTTVTTRSTSGRGETSTAETKRALLTMEEVLRMRPRDQIAFVEAHKPLKLGKTPYWEQPAVTARPLPNPYHKATPRAGWRTTGTGLRQALMRTALWALTPHPVAAVLYLLAAAAVIVPQVAG